jgi:hypothetical protein
MPGRARRGPCEAFALGAALDLRPFRPRAPAPACPHAPPAPAMATPLSAASEALGTAAAVLVAAALALAPVGQSGCDGGSVVLAAGGDDARTATKVAGGSASTTGKGSLRSVVKNITRGVNLEGTSWKQADLEGVSFQQSILRQANFSGSMLASASFFDADLSGADLSDANLSFANFELTNMRGVNATNAIFSGAYMSSTTKFDGITITGSDWTECLLRKDQQKYLCSRASGTNPSTGVDTRDSLMCPPE